MRATIMLSDWAEAVGGKLYMQGAGWDRILADTPASFAVVVAVRIGYDETNVRNQAKLSLTTEDGEPFPQDKPVVFDFEFEAGRPDGMVPGQVQSTGFAGKVTGLTLPRGGYRFQFIIGDGDILDEVPFQAVDAL